MPGSLAFLVFDCPQSASFAERNGDFYVIDAFLANPFQLCLRAFINDVSTPPFGNMSVKPTRNGLHAMNPTSPFSLRNNCYLKILIIATGNGKKLLSCTAGCALNEGFTFT